MSHFYAQAGAGAPAVTINAYDAEQPFAVVAFGATWDITATGPASCRRVAAAWDTAATATQTAQKAARRPARQDKKEAHR